MSLKILTFFLFLIAFSVQSAKDCESYFNYLIQYDKTEWSLENLIKIVDNFALETKFRNYIARNYSKEVVNRVHWVSNKINGFHKDRIFINFFIELEKTKLIIKKNKNWSKAKDNWLNGTGYYLYPHHLGTKSKEHLGSFQAISDNIDYLKELDVDYIYILPHYDSPLKDGGYDVRNFKKPLEELGTIDDFKDMVKKLKENNINVMIDYIPGHVSEESEWFKKALANDEKYLNYFINTNRKPESRLIKQGDETYLVYKDENTQQEYGRLLLFPDIIKSQWIPESSGQYFYSSFFPFQKDLNNQNPDVLREHLENLGFWINLGVKGIRSDAIPWWIKPPGTNGMHQEESKALAEYFNTFFKLIDPNIIHLPESVDAYKNARKYLGRPTRMFGEERGTMADALFNFEKSNEIYQSFVTGDFSSHYRYLVNHQKDYTIQNTHEVLYGFEHHDEIYGFASQQKFKNKILESNGILYKNETSKGSRLASLLKGDLNQIKSAQKFYFAHHGSIMIYQGTELGFKNNYDHAYKVTIKNLEQLREKNIISADHPVFKEIAQIESSGAELTDKNSSFPELNKFVEGRLLHREPLTVDDLAKAKNSKNETFNAVKRLLAIRKKSKALREGGKEIPLTTLRKDVSAFVRRYTKNNKVEDEVLTLTNGLNRPTVVNIPLNTLTSKTRFSLLELEYETAIPFQQHRDFISIFLKPKETLWLKIL